MLKGVLLLVDGCEGRGSETGRRNWWSEWELGYEGLEEPA